MVHCEGAARASLILPKILSYLTEDPVFFHEPEDFPFIIRNLYIPSQAIPGQRQITDIFCSIRTRCFISVFLLKNMTKKRLYKLYLKISWDLTLQKVAGACVLCSYCQIVLELWQRTKIQYFLCYIITKSWSIRKNGMGTYLKRTENGSIPLIV